MGYVEMGAMREAMVGMRVLPRLVRVQGDGTE